MCKNVFVFCCSLIKQSTLSKQWEIRLKFLFLLHLWLHSCLDENEADGKISTERCAGFVFGTGSPCARRERLFAQCYWWSPAVRESAHICIICSRRERGCAQTQTQRKWGMERILKNASCLLVKEQRVCPARRRALET